MKFPVYSSNMDFRMNFATPVPRLLFAQKYEFFPGEASPLRRCYASALLLIGAGAGTLRTEAGELAIAPGMFVYIPAGRLHGWTADKTAPVVKYCAYFDWDRVERADFHYQKHFFHNMGGDASFDADRIAVHPDWSDILVVPLKNPGAWTSAFMEFISDPELLDAKHMEDAVRIQGAFLQFLGRTLQWVGRGKRAADPRIRTMLERIEQAGLARAEAELFAWADETGLSRSRFHQLFKEAAGYPPKHYLGRLKLKRVVDDLLSSKLNMTQIADKYGFASIHYFSRYFRKSVGLTPSEYRRRYR